MAGQHLFALHSMTNRIFANVKILTSPTHTDPSSAANPRLRPHVHKLLYKELPSWSITNRRLLVNLIRARKPPRHSVTSDIEYSVRTRSSCLVRLNVFFSLDSPFGSRYFGKKHSHLLQLDLPCATIIKRCNGKWRCVCLRRTVCVHRCGYLPLSGGDEHSFFITFITNKWRKVLQVAIELRRMIPLG